MSGVLDGDMTASASLGFTAPTYDLPDAGGASRGGNTYRTTVSGVASPEQVAALVEQGQRTNEFLAGVSA